LLTVLHLLFRILCFIADSADQKQRHQSVQVLSIYCSKYRLTGETGLGKTNLYIYVVGKKALAKLFLQVLGSYPVNY